MRKGRILTPGVALVGGQGGLVWIESPGIGYEEGRRTKRIWGSLGSGLLEYQQTTDVWTQNMHMMGFEDTGTYPAVYMDFFHTAHYQGTDELLPGMCLEDF